MDLAQRVHDALGLHASERPAAERQVEPPPLHVERVGVVDGEPDALPQLGREREYRACTTTIRVCAGLPGAAGGASVEA
jgi:hypothetical protein